MTIEEHTNAGIIDHRVYNEYSPQMESFMDSVHSFLIGLGQEFYNDRLRPTLIPIINVADRTLINSLERLRQLRDLE